MEHLGIDPNASRMLSERSTIWARTPVDILCNKSQLLLWFSDILREAAKFWDEGQYPTFLNRVDKISNLNKTFSRRKMEDVCSEPCCQTLCYPFFRKTTPNYLHVIVPTGER